jgi:hypothetical protein
LGFVGAGRVAYKAYLFVNCGSPFLLSVGHMAEGQLASLPYEITASQTELPPQLARIAASSPQHARSGRWCCRQIENLRRPSDFVPVARTTAKSRQPPLQILLGYSSLSLFFLFFVGLVFVGFVGD